MVAEREEVIGTVWMDWNEVVLADWSGLLVWRT